jgi:hypothetical protein
VEGNGSLPLPAILPYVIGSQSFQDFKNSPCSDLDMVGPSKFHVPEASCTHPQYDGVEVWNLKKMGPSKRELGHTAYTLMNGLILPQGTVSCLVGLD